MATVGLKVTTPKPCKEHNKKDCPFCSAKEDPDELENLICQDDPAETRDQKENSGPGASEPEADEPEDSEMEIVWQKFSNDSKKLTDALKKLDPDLGAAREITINKQKFRSQTAAHHLIPGNGSLSKSTLFKQQKYLWKDGKVKGNIGYDVNSRANGVFLPGCYAYVGKWGSGGGKFTSSNKKAGVDAKAYADRSMTDWKRHFHNAHKEYNSFVWKVLDNINKKLKQTQQDCEEGQKSKDKSPAERKPLLQLINVLNKVSSKMRDMLSGPRTKWRSNIYTSQFAADFMATKGVSDTVSETDISDAVVPK